jgi:uncharacterized membrane protein
MTAQLREYAHHHVALVVIIALCAWISLSMIVRMWLRYRSDSFLKKLGWTLVLCVPLFGWLFFCGFYLPLAENEVKAPVNADAFSGGH